MQIYIKLINNFKLFTIVRKTIKKMLINLK
jgi:hypothetical protein